MNIKHVFLDTSIYKSNNFNFASENFKTLINLVNEGKVILYSTSITDNEVKSNIKESVSDVRELINSLINNAYVLRNTSPFASVFNEKKPANKAQDEINANYEKFKVDTRMVLIPISNVNIEDVFSRYFSASPPFSAKKKDEIPDAFVLNAIKQKFESQNENCYIISTDNDMEMYCHENNNLTYLDSIKSMLHLISQEGNYIAAMEFVDWNIDHILETFSSSLFDHPFELDDTDGSIDDIGFGNLQLDQEPYITDIEKDKIKLTMSITFDYNAGGSILDETASPYDSETKSYLWRDYVAWNSNGQITVETDVEIVNINYNEGLETYEEVDEMEIYIKQINSGMPILIREVFV